MLIETNSVCDTDSCVCVWIMEKQSGLNVQKNIQFQHGFVCVWGSNPKSLWDEYFKSFLLWKYWYFLLRWRMFDATLVSEQRVKHRFWPTSIFNRVIFNVLAPGSLVPRSKFETCVHSFKSSLRFFKLKCFKALKQLHYKNFLTDRFISSATSWKHGTAGSIGTRKESENKETGKHETFDRCS